MSWIGGLAEWQQEDTTYLSIAFTWKLRDAIARAQFARAQGLKVVAGGPALFKKPHGPEADTDHDFVKAKKRLAELADMPDVLLGIGEPVTHHNPHATFASRGCPKDCHFCIVWRMEGQAFTLLPEFEPRPYLCDNNLSALPPEYQDHIIERYRARGVKLVDANSGFEPETFTPDVYERWKPLVNAGGGPWRFAYDELKERTQCLAVMQMLADEPQKRKRVYVLIGNEPFAECMQRIQEVIDHGCEPHVQPFIKLNALERKPHAKFDWTEAQLLAVARWANRRLWKYTDFAGYSSSVRTGRGSDDGGGGPGGYDAQQGLFL